MTAPQVEFWFDYSCPYAYLASTQLTRLRAQCQAELVYRPMLLGGLFRAIGAGDGPMAELSASRRAYLQADLARWSRHWGVPLSTPAGHPNKTVFALRTTLAVAPARRPHVIAELFAAYWQRGLDVSVREVVAEALTRAGLGAEEVAACLADAESEPIKQALFACTDEAREHGVFGAPTFRVLRAGASPLLAWGQDRLPWVVAMCQGWDGVSPRGSEPARGLHAPPGTHTLEYYFDFSSPYAYLGATQVAAVAKRLGASLVWRPFLLGALFRTIGQVDVPLFRMPPAKQAYQYAELQRWAAWWHVPFRFPHNFPVKTTKALRIALALDTADRERWIAAVFEAYWVRGEAIDRDEPLLLHAQRLALPERLLAEADQEPLRAKLVEATATAASQGVFGAPTAILHHGGEKTLLWGQDRILELQAPAGST